MKTNHAIAFALTTAAMVTSVSVIRPSAQAPAGPDQMVAALKQNRGESQKRLRQYEWIETTSISLKGEEKSRKQQRVYYGADGKLTKLPIGQPQPQAAQGGGRSGRLKKRIVENKKNEMQEYMERAAGLMQMYVPPTPALIQQAKDRGNMLLRPQPQGPIRVEFQNFVQPSICTARTVRSGSDPT